MDWIHAQALYKYNSSDLGVISSDSYKGRRVKVLHEGFNEMMSNQGYESSGQSNRLEWKQIINNVRIIVIFIHLLN